jgi:hypothetical protein
MKGSAAAGSTMTLVKGLLHTMHWLKAKTGMLISAAAVVVVGSSVVLWSGIRVQAARAQAQAFEAKQQAERAAEALNAAPTTDANKLEDEQKALALAREQKLAAERAGGPVNLAQNGDIDKLNAERRAAQQTNARTGGK